MDLPAPVVRKAMTNADPTATIIPTMIWCIIAIGISIPQEPKGRSYKRLNIDIG
jgi:hypothetical protein